MSRVVVGRTRDPRTGSWVPKYEEIDPTKDPSAPTTPVPPVDESEIQEEVSTTFREREFVLRGTVHFTVANPHIRAGELLQLLGLGNAFSGLYHTTSTKHTISSEAGYTLTAEVTRNALGMGATPPASPADSEPTRSPKPAANVSVPPGTYHIMQRGDTLWGLARKHYGNGSAYTRILQANPAITDPHRIPIGMRVIIP